MWTSKEHAAACPPFVAQVTSYLDEPRISAQLAGKFEEVPKRLSFVKGCRFLNQQIHVDIIAVTPQYGREYASDTGIAV